MNIWTPPRELTQSVPRSVGIRNKAKPEVTMLIVMFLGFPVWFTVSHNRPLLVDPIGIVILSVFLSVYIILFIIGVTNYYKQKKLIKWGHAAKATITGQKDVTSRFGKTITATYRFTDADGKIVD